MSVNKLRIKKINDLSYDKGAVVYHMCRDIRARDNDALLFAQELAFSKNAPLIVNYVIWNYKWEGATRRFYDWVIPSLKEVEKELRSHNIPLIITYKEKKTLHTQTLSTKIHDHIGAVVIDQLPLTFMKKWKDDFVRHQTIPLYEVDAHNCIPVWEASNKQEFSARTIRSKIHAKIEMFMDNYDPLLDHVYNKTIIDEITPIDWQEVTKKIVCNEDVFGVGDFVPGEQAAHKVLRVFLNEKINSYEHDRNDFTKNGQSNLSPYIAHGNISRRYIISLLLREKRKTAQESFTSTSNGSNGKSGSVAAFIEECVVRAELSDNFCYYNMYYDKADGFPLWARETLNKAREDKRQYVYSLKEFEKSDTHDALWNAAQTQMVCTGKMHGYMRMYWAKKILEWTTSPEEAMRIAVYLNDTYELDGRDPNGYVGCAWSIGGVHDRPWFPRPYFGAVRYMAESGVKKRGDIRIYIEKWSNSNNRMF